MRYQPFIVFLCAVVLASGASAQQGTITFSPSNAYLYPHWPGPGSPFCDFAGYVTLQSTSNYPVALSSSSFLTSVWHGNALGTLTLYVNATMTVNTCAGLGGRQTMTANCPVGPSTLPAHGTCQAIVAFAGSTFGTWAGTITATGTAQSQPPAPISGTINVTALFTQ